MLGADCTIFLGDGLRPDLLFNKNPFPSLPGSPEVIAPYLRSVAESRGAFGVSHTRVPTESRPGHVAIIGVYFLVQVRPLYSLYGPGGMYEDVSAVTKVCEVIYYSFGLTKMRLHRDGKQTQYCDPHILVAIL